MLKFNLLVLVAASIALFGNASENVTLIAEAKNPINAKPKIEIASYTLQEQAQALIGLAKWYSQKNGSQAAKELLTNNDLKIFDPLLQKFGLLLFDIVQQMSQFNEEQYPQDQDMLSSYSYPPIPVAEILASFQPTLFDPSKFNSTVEHWKAYLKSQQNFFESELAKIKEAMVQDRKRTDLNQADAQYNAKNWQDAKESVKKELENNAKKQELVSALIGAIKGARRLVMSSK